MSRFIIINNKRDEVYDLQDGSLRTEPVAYLKRGTTAMDEIKIFSAEGLLDAIEWMTASTIDSIELRAINLDEDEVENAKAEEDERREKLRKENMKRIDAQVHHGMTSRSVKE